MRKDRRVSERESPTIVIAGGGTAGWMAAAAFARFLAPRWRIRLVESEAIGTVGVGEATIPPIRAFNAGLGIDEAEFVRETQGSFKLGIEFAGWNGPDSRYIHAFGGIGRPLGLIGFLPYWLRHRAEGGTRGLWDFAPGAVAAYQNRFGHPQQRAGGPPSGIAWAYHFDASLYAAYLRRYAEARGVERHEGRILDVARDGESGDISALILDGERMIEGDLFVDCTGFAALLAGKALGTPYRDWTHWLPCDRALAAPCARTDPLTPYTRATARAAGWQWRIPLQHRTGNGLVYSSAHIADDAAADMLLANLDGEALGDPRPLRFTTGRREQAWTRNCVSLGLAGGFLEPLESTSIHLVQIGIAELLKFLPGRAIAEADRAAYNRRIAFETDRIRDFIVLHYHANGREGDFWRDCRAMAIPDTLAEKIALFRANGRIVRVDEELFTEVGWMQVMLGQGMEPLGYHPLADALTADQLAEFIALAAADAGRQAAALPLHQDFIAARCAAPSPERIPA
ncbi:tryptophan 7-halogenase [Sphingomonas gilva]|uniref:Tryptophan 7-halogenase n=1 Tax=Sphingomonas gilva TaxID=2305907 RepID=A0A396RZ84_9SPHN|nr:tryptophan halogenase family protein [Sphingomonas gilva]RHW19051.1 tryptophan 7-halogenase [Sphingomonas gilva]